MTVLLLSVPSAGVTSVSYDSLLPFVIVRAQSSIPVPKRRSEHPQRLGGGEGGGEVASRFRSPYSVCTVLPTEEGTHSHPSVPPNCSPQLPGPQEGRPVVEREEGREPCSSGGGVGLSGILGESSSVIAGALQLLSLTRN